MKTRKILIVMASLCVTIMLQAQVKLSFNPEKGVTYTQLFKVEQTGKQTVNGQEIPLNTSVDMLFAMNVKDKSNTEISVECTYKEIEMSMVSPMATINYDSKKSAENLLEPEKMMSQVLGSLIDKTIKVVYEPNGSVKSVSGFSEILADIQKNADPAIQQVASLFLQSFNDDVLKQMFGQTYSFYPKNAVKASDSWNSDFAFVIMGINMDTKNTYTLKSVKNNVALIDLVSVLSMGQDMSGNQKGEITLDVKTGMIISSVATQTLKGKLNMQGMDIAMDIVSKSTVTSE